MRISWRTLVFCGLIAARGQSAFIEFSDSATFNATVPGVVLQDFEVVSGFPLAPAGLDFIDATIDLSTPGGDSDVSLQDFGNGFGQAIGGRLGGGVENFLPVLISFSAPYYAVGFDDLDLTPDEFAIITVNFAAGPSVTFSRFELDSDFSTAAFFGIWSTIPITSVEVYSADNIGDPPGSRANLIDNIVYSRAALIPEPATWITSATVLALLIARRRLRR
jgi:hypothetical protein